MLYDTPTTTVCVHLTHGNFDIDLHQQPTGTLCLSLGSFVSIFLSDEVRERLAKALLAPAARPPYPGYPPAV